MCRFASLLSGQVGVESFEMRTFEFREHESLKKTNKTKKKRKKEKPMMTVQSSPGANRQCADKRQQKSSLIDMRHRERSTVDRKRR